MSLRPIAFLVAAVVLAANDAKAQDSVSRGVRIGLTYQPGTKPGVVVLPIKGVGGDSLQVMLQRDLDAGDRVEIIGGAGTSAYESVQQAASALNYALWKTLGADGIVEATLTGPTLHVALHDARAGRVIQSRDFPLPAGVAIAPWRMAVHAVSDEVERWITGMRGIAATRVAFVRAGRVVIADTDGWGEHDVTTAGTALAPAWHPTGKYIGYSTLGDHGWRIVMRDLGAGTSRALTTTPDGLNTTPEFSPDGETVVYAHGAEAGTDLYATDALHDGPARRVTVGRGSDNISPSFSPDGRRLAFTSGRVGHPEVYIADADGSNVELLTSYAFGDQNYRSNPAWSPDGRVIAFQSQIGGVFQIMTINLRDRSVKQLTSEGVNEDPSWAPDGRHLVFTSSRTGTKALFIVDAESGRTRQLTHTPGARLAAWSRWLDQAP